MPWVKKAKKTWAKKSKASYGRKRPQDALGVMPSVSVAVPKSVQTVRKLYHRYADYIKCAGIGGSSYQAQFALGSAPYVSLSNYLYYADNWTSTVKEFDQFRPTKLRIKYEPALRYSGNNGNLIMVADFDQNSTSLTTAQQAASYRTSKLLPMNDPWEIEYDIPLAVSNVWYDTASPASWLASLTLFNAASLGGNYSNPGALVSVGDLLIEVEAVFRGVQ